MWLFTTWYILVCQTPMRQYKCAYAHSTKTSKGKNITRTYQQLNKQLNTQYQQYQQYPTNMLLLYTLLKNKIKNKTCVTLKPEVQGQSIGPMERCPYPSSRVARASFLGGWKLRAGNRKKCWNCWETVGKLLVKMVEIVGKRCWNKPSLGMVNFYSQFWDWNVDSTRDSSSGFHQLIVCQVAFHRKLGSFDQVADLRIAEEKWVWRAAVYLWRASPVSKFFFLSKGLWDKKHTNDVLFVVKRRSWYMDQMKKTLKSQYCRYFRSWGTNHRGLWWITSKTGAVAGNATARHLTNFHWGVCHKKLEKNYVTFANDLKFTMKEAINQIKHRSETSSHLKEHNFILQLVEIWLRRELDQLPGCDPRRDHGREREDAAYLFWWKPGGFSPKTHSILFLWINFGTCSMCSTWGHQKCFFFQKPPLLCFSIVFFRFSTKIHLKGSPTNTQHINRRSLQDRHEGLLEVHPGHGRIGAHGAACGAGGHLVAAGSQLHERLPRQPGPPSASLTSFGANNGLWCFVGV